MAISVTGINAKKFSYNYNELFYLRIFIRWGGIQCKASHLLNQLITLSHISWNYFFAKYLGPNPFQSTCLVFSNKSKPSSLKKYVCVMKLYNSFTNFIKWILCHQAKQEHSDSFHRRSFEHRTEKMVRFAQRKDTLWHRKCQFISSWHQLWIYNRSQVLRNNDTVTLVRFIHL